MTPFLAPSAGFLTLTLHAHLPYVVNHGTWPHGMEWLHEAAAETYLPLLRVLADLERDGIGLYCNLNLSPILLEQLTHPVFVAEFPKYLNRKIIAAREDEAFFTQSGEAQYAETARHWNRFFTQALDQFQALGQDIVAGFRHFHEAGQIDIITCTATHGYLPLLGTDESVRAQVRVAVQTHQRHLQRAPRGIWSPECGYRPAGIWSYPIADAGGSEAAPAFARIGVEQAFAESGLSFFYVDTHLVQQSQPTHSPYAAHTAPTPTPGPSASPDRSLYHPHLVDGSYGGPGSRLHPTTVFARDPGTGLQVWSGDAGYPGDGAYLDFHKKRWPGGHRYWRVTGHRVDMNDKQPYHLPDAAERARVHAAHFVGLVREALSSSLADATPPVLCAPFDAELFGHWWFEGPLWLEALARELHTHAKDIALITSATYLDRFPAAETIALPEGSWGAGGHHHVWMNPDTAWTWTHIYPAERFVRDLATSGRWKDSPVGGRIARQLCRELLLLESSDWQFLITTGAARDYAELRFHAHLNQFNDLKCIWESAAAAGSIDAAQEARLAEIELRDNIFLDLDPSFWATGAHATTPAKHVAS